MGRLSAHVCRLIDRRMSHGMPGLVVPGILLLAASLVLVAAVDIRARLVPVGFSSLLLATALLLPLLGRIRTLANHLPSPRHVDPFADCLAQTRRSRCDSVECGQRLVGPQAG